MEKDLALKRIIELMRESEVCCLTTIDEMGYPRTRAMLNLRNAAMFPELKSFFSKIDDYTLFFTTNTSSRKVGQLQQNSRASAFFSIPAQWQGLMAGGCLELVEDRELKNSLWQEGWTMYYPEGPLDPDYAVLRMRPDKICLYYQLDNFEMKVE